MINQIDQRLRMDQSAAQACRDCCNVHWIANGTGDRFKWPVFGLGEATSLDEIGDPAIYCILVVTYPKYLSAITLFLHPV